MNDTDARAIRINAPEFSEDEAGSTVSTVVHVGRRRHDVRFRFNIGGLSRTTDFMLPVTLVSAMAHKRPLVFEAPLSSDLKDRIAAVQKAYRDWRPHLAAVDVRADARQPERDGDNRGTACFFTGGVDSYYTLFSNLNEISTVIFMHGSDVFLEDTALRARVKESLNRMSRELGKKVVEIETNVRDNFSDYYTFPRDNNGSLLVATSYLLKHHFKKIFIASPPPLPLPKTTPSTFTDPNWNLPDLDLMHHGATVPRHEKIAAIANHPVVAETLRVCMTNPKSAYNCCRCEKCVRTMVDLRIAGRLDAFRKVFPLPLRPEDVARLHLTGISRIVLSDTLAHMKKTGKDPELAAAVEKALQHRLPTNVRGWILWLLYVLNGTSWWLPLQARLFGGARGKLKLRSLVNSLLHPQEQS